jgi:HD superfamily phosphodiesterase
MAVADGIDPDEASAAAWLHDIGYSTGIHNGHAEASLRICEEENLRLSPAQVDAILNHGTNAHPTTELGKLMQKADKLSMIDFDLFKLFYPNALHVFKKQWLPAIAAIIPDEGEEGK